MNTGDLSGLELTRILVQLQFHKKTRFHFFHGPALNGFLCHALKRHPLGKDIALYPVETGHVAYNQKDCYNFLLTRFGPPSGDFPGILKDRLKAYGKKKEGTPEVKHQPFCHYDVIRVETLPGPVCPLEQEDDDEKKEATLTLQLLTPLRMSKKIGEGNIKPFDTSYFDIKQFINLVYRRIFDLLKSNSSFNKEFSQPALPKCTLLKKTLLLIDNPFRDKNGSGRKKTKKDMSFAGIMGKIVFRIEIDNFWKQILRLGQFVQAGNNTSFGFGKYMIREWQTGPEISPARTFFGEMTTQSNILEAFVHVKANAGQQGSDRETIEGFEEQLYENLNALTDEVTGSAYVPKDLLGILLPEKKLRALAIPAVRDRILQRAAVQVISPSIDILLEENSYAYRKGLSRMSAAEAIRRAYNEGYRIVLESDINSFFDTVDFTLLFDKLDILFPFDPVLPLLKTWVTLPVVFCGQKIIRKQGLPQGAVISPVLANLYLDEFDEAIGKDFRLVRYADDFIILCKSVEQAKDALEKVKEILKNIELEINISKTKITDFNTGFHYLGYLFCRSLIIEEKKKSGTVFNIDTDSRPGSMDLKEIDPGKVPVQSWLSCVDFGNIKELKKQKTTGDIAIRPLPPCSGQKLPLYITNRPAK